MLRVNEHGMHQMLTVGCDSLRRDVGSAKQQSYNEISGELIG